MRDYNSKSEALALIQEITQERSDEDERGKNVDVVATEELGVGQGE